MSDPIERLRRKAQNEATALALNEALHLAEAEIKRLRAAGVGYSQQTVDALSSERDRLRAALIAAMEIVQRERVRIAYNAKGAPPAIEIGYADILHRLDAVIAQADAAMKEQE